MSELTYLECPCCGDDGAVSDVDGNFTDAQPLICGCPGWVSVDGDGDEEPYINNGDEPCHHCADEAQQEGATVTSWKVSRSREGWHVVTLSRAITASTWTVRRRTVACHRNSILGVLMSEIGLSRQSLDGLRVTPRGASQEPRR